MRDILMLELANLSKHYAKLYQETSLTGIGCDGTVQIGTEDFRATFDSFESKDIGDSYMRLSSKMYDVEFIALETKEVE